MFERLLKILIQHNVSFRVTFGEYGELDYTELDMIKPSEQIVQQLCAVNDYIQVTEVSLGVYTHQITLV